MSDAVAMQGPNPYYNNAQHLNPDQVIELGHMPPKAKVAKEDAKDDGENSQSPYPVCKITPTSIQLEQDEENDCGKCTTITELWQLILLNILIIASIVCLIWSKSLVNDLAVFLPSLFVLLMSVPFYYMKAFSLNNLYQGMAMHRLFWKTPKNNGVAYISAFDEIPEHIEERLKRYVEAPPRLAFELINKDNDGEYTITTTFRNEVTLIECEDVSPDVSEFLAQYKQRDMNGTLLRFRIELELSEDDEKYLREKNKRFVSANKSKEWHEWTKAADTRLANSAHTGYDELWAINGHDLDACCLNNFCVAITKILTLYVLYDLITGSCIRAFVFPIRKRAKVDRDKPWILSKSSRRDLNVSVDIST